MHALWMVLLSIALIGAIPQYAHFQYHNPETLIEGIQLRKDARPPVIPTTLLFVGDIMLGRDVENYMNRYGSQYPFAAVGTLLTSPDRTIGNFEGIVSKPHVQAPSMTFQFSVREDFLKELTEQGFDILSLANNHSGDYGYAALAHTRNLCVEFTVICAGSARDVDETASFVQVVRDVSVGFLFGHTTWGTQRTEELVERMTTLTTQSQVQVAYIHWGNEYELVHHGSQRALAHALIDAGADVVIGHHPHVVQDVALYQGKPIFYSLGNFIFDQYWEESVQSGLGVQMSIHTDTIEYQAIPFTTKTARNQPTIMDDSDTQKLFTRIFAPLATTVGVAVASGTISVAR